MQKKNTSKREDNNYFPVECSECHKTFQIPVKPYVLIQYLVRSAIRNSNLRNHWI